MLNYGKKTTTKFECLIKESKRQIMSDVAGIILEKNKNKENTPWVVYYANSSCIFPIQETSKHKKNHIIINFKINFLPLYDETKKK